MRRASALDELLPVIGKDHAKYWFASWSQTAYLDSGMLTLSLEFGFCSLHRGGGSMVMRRLRQGVSLILMTVFLAVVPALAQQFPSETLKAQRRRITDLYETGSYAEALALQRVLVARIETAETADAGKPGPKTADALGNLAWYALTARDFSEALAASERARALVSDQIWVETNRAHALVFLGRIEEARRIYFAHKGARLTVGSDKTWEDMVADDFEELRKRGLAHAAFDEIATELGLSKTRPKARSRSTTIRTGCRPIASLTPPAAAAAR